VIFYKDSSLYIYISFCFLRISKFLSHNKWRMRNYDIGWCWWNLRIIAIQQNQKSQKFTHFNIRNYLSFLHLYLSNFQYSQEKWIEVGLWDHAIVLYKMLILIIYWKFGPILIIAAKCYLILLKMATTLTIFWLCNH
jgi:hypothetical protein